MSVLTSTPNKIFRSAKGQGIRPFVESPCENQDLQYDLPQMSMKHSLQISRNWTLSPTTTPKCCLPNAHHCQQKSFGLLFPKWERCGLGSKQRTRWCCCLIPAPPFRLTPNEAKGGSPYKGCLTLFVLKCS